MNDFLPDVASNVQSAVAAPLEWVGMRGIELPLALEDANHAHWVQASMDVHVDLPDARIKGIHMSRLYLLADALPGDGPVGPERLASLLAAMVDNHADCGTTRAGIALECRLLVRQPSLSTPGLAGWKAYPVRIEATHDGTDTDFTVQVSVVYSSTCPCSAALSRQLVSQAFASEFGEAASLEPSQVTAWLSDHASYATPHSQRSVAQVRLPLKTSETFRWREWIARIETALGTPVQTAVKRKDEQAFARLNGANLMYVEDAARRVQAALAGDYPTARVEVRHFGSLPPMMHSRQPAPPACRLAGHRGTNP